MPITTTLGTGAARLPITGRAYMKRPGGATWRSGYATVCKTVYTSSILVVASNLFKALGRALKAVATELPPEGS